MNGADTRLFYTKAKETIDQLIPTCYILDYNKFESIHNKVERIYVRRYNKRKLLHDRNKIHNDQSTTETEIF